MGDAGDPPGNDEDLEPQLPHTGREHDDEPDGDERGKHPEQRPPKDEVPNPEQGSIPERGGDRVGGRRRSRRPGRLGRLPKGNRLELDVSSVRLPTARTLVKPSILIRNRRDNEVRLRGRPNDGFGASRRRRRRQCRLGHRFTHRQCGYWRRGFGRLGQRRR
jgi:hypothetical protein